MGANLLELSGAQRNKQYYHHHYRHQASRQICEAHITIWKVAIDRYKQAQVAWQLNTIDVNPFRYEIPTNDDAHV